ncbi:hypothetical protein HOG98_04940 [bacterium]|jgi:hypothetical protein|nr:hypothetical protein [bacterium]
MNKFLLRTFKKIGSIFIVQSETNTWVNFKKYNFGFYETMNPTSKRRFLKKLAKSSSLYIYLSSNVIHSINHKQSTMPIKKRINESIQSLQTSTLNSNKIQVSFIDSLFISAGILIIVAYLLLGLQLNKTADSLRSSITYKTQEKRFLTKTITINQKKDKRYKLLTDPSLNKTNQNSNPTIPHTYKLSENITLLPILMNGPFKFIELNAEQNKLTVTFQTNTESVDSFIYWAQDLETKLNCTFSLNVNEPKAQYTLISKRKFKS